MVKDTAESEQHPYPSESASEALFLPGLGSGPRHRGYLRMADGHQGRSIIHKQEDIPC